MSLHATAKRDSQIDCQRIQAQIETRTHASVESLTVTTVNDQVVLAGFASSFYIKQLATQATLEVEPEISFVNDIQVREFPR